MTTVAIPNPYAKQRRYCLNNPQKKRAHDRVGWMIRTGKLKPAKEMKCVCGKTAVSWHHVNGYDIEHIEDVEAKCQGCHGEEHY